MKKGLIFYVTEGKDSVPPDQNWSQLTATFNLPTAAAACVAVSEDEIAYGWWRLLCRGMHQVFCVKATYDETSDELKPFGVPLRLYG